MHLHLETLAPSATTSALELAALGLDIWLLALVRTETKVLDGLARVLGAPQQDSVGTGGGTESELIEGDGLTTSGQDAGAGGSSEPQSSDGELGDLKDTVVIGNGSDNNNGLVGLQGLLVVDIAENPGERNGGAVDLGHEQAAEDDLVEGGIGTPGQKPVNLDQNPKVRVVGLGRLAVVGRLLVTQIDTHFCCGYVLSLIW